MNRYTTKHFWRMTESEQGEWIRYEDYKEEIERLRMERDSYRELYRETHNDWLNVPIHYQRLSDHFIFRIGVLFTVLMATYGIIVGKLIVWSLDIL